MNRVQPMAAQLIIHLKYHNVFDKLWNLQKKTISTWTIYFYGNAKYNSLNNMSVVTNIHCSYYSNTDSILNVLSWNHNLCCRCHN